MADGDGQQALRYSAFISYSHTDSAFARRLHRKLENYRLPRRLAEQRGESGPAARRLRPIFRDREELPAAADLTQAVRSALSESSYLIVICSPHSSTSAWVAREIELFRDLHGDGGILAALVDGATDDAFRCLFGGTKDGGQSPEPLAADFRRDGDGGRLAYLKLVAALAGVRLDALIQRDAQRRVRQATAVGASALLGMTAMGVLALIAINARNATERERARGAALIDYSLSDLRDHLKSVGRLDVLNLVNQGALRYYADQDLSGLPAQALVERAKLLQAIGEDDEKRGNLKAAQAQFDEALRATSTLLLADPNDPMRIFAHAQSEYWVGFIDWKLGDDIGADNCFKSYAYLARRLVNIAPSNPDWVLEKGYSESNLAMYALRHSMDVAKAEPLFRAALDDFLHVSSRHPNDKDLQLEIADGYAWIADVERLRGDCAESIVNRALERRILDYQLARDPRDFQARNEMIANSLARARIASALGQFPSAIAQLEKDQDAAFALANDDPENVSLASEIRAIELFKVQAWLMMPDIQRPSPATINAKLGDCSSNKAAPDYNELHTFCGMLKSQFLEHGRGGVATGQYSFALHAEGAASNRLTERWLIDLRGNGVTRCQ